MTVLISRGWLLFGWAVPDLDPNTDDAYIAHGSFIRVFNGMLYGLGTMVISKLPSGGISDGGSLSLRYHPARGRRLHATKENGQGLTLKKTKH